MTSFNILSLSLPNTNLFPELFCSAYFIVLIAGIIFVYGKKRSSLDIKLSLIYCACAMIIVLNSNMFLIFCLIELMAITATLLIFNGGDKKAKASGIRYFIIHMTSGFLILIGLIGSANISYPLQIDNLTITNLENLPAYILLAGLLINIASPPFSSWLSDCYSNATPGGSIFLTAYTSKTACFLLIKLFLGSEILVYIGTFMAIYGVIYALLEMNIRKIVCSVLISNLGLILIFIGYGTVDDLYLLAIILFNSTVYIALLMLCASFVVTLTNKNFYDEFFIDLSKIKWIIICGSISLLSLISFPFTVSYITKASILNNSDIGNIKIWLIICNVGITLAAAKLAWCLSSHSKTASLFPNNYSQLKSNDSLAGLLLASVCIISIFVFRIFMQTIYWQDIIKQLEIIFCSILLFYLITPIFYNMNKTTLNFDWLYRVAIYKSYIFLVSFSNRICCVISQMYHNKMTNLLNSNYITSLYKIKDMILIIICTLILLAILLLTS